MKDLSQFLKIDLQYLLKNLHYQPMVFLEYVYFLNHHHPLLRLLLMFVVLVVEDYENHDEAFRNEDL
jgi:hypothetical protein